MRALLPWLAASTIGLVAATPLPRRDDGPTYFFTLYGNASFSHLSRESVLMATLPETAAIHTPQPDSTPAAGHHPLPTLWGTLNWVSCSC